MSDEAAPAAGAPGGKRGAKTLILMLVTAIASAAAGFAVPQMLGGGTHAPSEETKHEPEPAAHEPVKTELSYVPFGEVIANLDDNRMMRYVRAKFSVAVDEKEAKNAETLIEEHRTVLKNWLLGYLQNKQVDEVRGTEGFNRIRREIQERFNDVLYPGGDTKIREVLFDEFNVQ